MSTVWPGAIQPPASRQCFLHRLRPQEAATRVLLQELSAQTPAVSATTAGIVPGVSTVTLPVDATGPGVASVATVLKPRQH